MELETSVLSVHIFVKRVAAIGLRRVELRLQDELACIHNGGIDPSASAVAALRRILSTSKDLLTGVNSVDDMVPA